MRAVEKVELAGIAIIIPAVGLLGRFLPVALHLGELLTITCVVWLLQGGTRDAWFLFALRSGRLQLPRRKMACMCLESSAGLTGIVIGVVLAVSGAGPNVSLSPVRWAAITATVLLGGFLLKDFVITWRPLGIRREREHPGIVFAWR